ncbi:peptidase M24, structural domain-containing protein [Mycena haematopus]|nr:peptidase M24, structural domain-containing protein [Mycena haematopus]
MNCQNNECPNGNPPSRLECPTCNKIGIRGSFFCGQECFKSGFGEDGTYNPFPKYSFTGPVRPTYPLSPRRAIPDHIQLPEYAQDGIPKAEQRAAGKPPQILNIEEIEKMKTVCRMSREILDIAAAAVRPGITTDEIDEIVHNATIERNAYPSPLNYRNFPKSVCTVYYQGFHGDVNGTYPVGKIGDESAKLIRTSRECLDKAIELCKPGALIRDIGNTIEPIARSNGCSVVRTYTGHGINTHFHCEPLNVPHYAKNKAPGTMKPGMVFTIEPMINLGSNWRDVHWPDNWTATTLTGKRSAQFEETLLITETGVEVLTAAPK